MTRIACCLTPEKAAAPQESYDAVANDFGVRFWRLTPQMEVAFPSPGVFEPGFITGHVEAIMATGADVYLNPVHVPAHASGGVPVFVPGMGGSSCQVLVEGGVQKALWPNLYQAMLNPVQVDDSHLIDVIATMLMTGLPDLGDTPDKIAWRFVKNYRGEQTHTWAWENPAAPGPPPHCYGAKGHEAADALSARRDFCLNPKLQPYADLQFLRWSAALLHRYYPGIKFGGWGNEFGNEMEFLPNRFDGAKFEGGEDTVATRVMPMTNAYVAGLPHSVVVVGGEHDGVDIMRRCIEAEAQCDLISFHPYPASDPSKVGEYMDMIKRVGDGRRAMVGEIEGDGMPDWLDGTLRKWPELYAICILDWQGWYVNWQAGGDDGLTLTPLGREMQKVIQGVQGKRRAVRS